MQFNNNTAIALNCQLLLYLDKKHILSNMRHNCEKFLEEINENTKNKFPPFRHLIEIDVIDMLDMLPELGDFLLNEPSKWQNICNEILFACLQSENNLCKNVIPAQVAATLRLTCLPCTVIRSNQHNYNGLVIFDGLLLTISKPMSYVYHTVWSCPEECEGNEVILHYIPKIPPKCYTCRSVLFENSGYRRCGEQVIATIKLKSNIISKSFAVVDDLIPKLKLGSRYVLSAIVEKKTILILSVEETFTLPAPITCSVPPDIDEVYKACDGYPWLFIYCLSSGIGINACPLNCFMNLKINLLLSLTSVKANALLDSAIVHVLIASYDTRYVGEIMNDAVKLADRLVFLGNSNSNVPTALVASCGGVCMLPLPFYTYSQKQIFSILSAIETGEIMTESYKLTLRAAVWAIGKDTKKLMLHNAANIFGNICRGDYGEYNDEITDFILQNAIHPTKNSMEDKQAAKDIASYMDLVAGVQVLLDPSAETLLRNYFLTARKNAPSGVTIGSMNALAATCLTSARLCRRANTNVEDAVFAIWLQISGSPEPRIAPEECLSTPANIKNLQKVMNNFKNWLENFTGVQLT